MPFAIKIKKTPPFSIKFWFFSRHAVTLYLYDKNTTILHSHYKYTLLRTAYEGANCSAGVRCTV